jgi:hypothetical protein
VRHLLQAADDPLLHLIEDVGLGVYSLGKEFVVM